MQMTMNGCRKGLVPNQFRKMTRQTEIRIDLMK
jgi:hypothetical protein